MTSAISSTTDRNHKTSPVQSAPQNKPAPQPTTTQVHTGDAQVRGQDGATARGYGIDVNHDNRYDGRDGVLAFDFNHDGKYSGKEISDSRDGLQAFGGNRDLDNDGSTDAAEAQTADRLASLISRFDADGDRKLSNSELKTAGAGIVGDGGVRSIDELGTDRKASLQALDPANSSALLDMLGTDAADPAADPAAAGDKPAADGSSPAGGGSAPAGAASDKGPTEKCDAPDGFLWKPESDSNGNLVILLPKSMAGKVKDVKVTTPDGQTLDQGATKGNFGDGRPIFRFNKPGGSFPNGSVVVITMADGSQQSVTIPNTSIRNEGGGGGDKQQK